MCYLLMYSVAVTIRCVWFKVGDILKSLKLLVYKHEQGLEEVCFSDARTFLVLAFSCIELFQNSDNVIVFIRLVWTSMSTHATVRGLR